MQVYRKEPPRPSDYLPHVFGPHMGTCLAPYLPPSIQRGQVQAQGEMRTVSTVFVNLDYTYERGAKQLLKLQAAVASMQRAVYHYQGAVRQFLVDDKGSVLIAVWGIPPHSHEDDASRAVLAALRLGQTLLPLSLRARIGITTGRVFCGDVGSTERREVPLLPSSRLVSSPSASSTRWWGR